jgi:Rad3-related DNA helicase
VTNYAYWMNVQRANRDGGGLCIRNKSKEVVNPFEYLILDEAHNADKELSGFLHTEITLRELKDVLEEDEGWFGLLDGESPISEWKKWAKHEIDENIKPLIEMRAESAGSSADMKMLKRTMVLAQKLEMIANAPDKGWVVDAIKSRAVKGVGGYQFDPVWPAQYAESALFKGIEKVVLISATLRPKTLQLLGIDDEQSSFKEYPFIFDRKRCPVYWVPTVRMNFRTTDVEKMSWVHRIDRIIEMRLDRKGIVHVPSFHLQRFFLQHTEHKGLMKWNDTSWGAGEELGTAKVIESYLRAKAPCVLVSPSLSTGYDFAGSACEYQVIGKVPFPDMQSKAAQERKKRDPGYANYLAMQSLVQASGRGMRYAGDQCETLCVDDSVGWFMQNNRGMAPGWFQVRRVDGAIPEPPPALED